METSSGMDRPIFQRIDAVYLTLPAQARRVADTVLDHLGDIGTYSVGELAQMSGTSTATVSRLFSSLGFEDFAQVKLHARALRAEGIPIAGVEPNADTAKRLQQEIDNIRKAYDSLSGDKLEEVADIVAGAQNVIVIGFRSSFPIAMQLRESLLQGRSHVSLVPQQGQSSGEELANIGPDDLVIVLGFRRRLSQFDDLMEYLSTKEATILLIADSTARRYAAWADIWLDCPIDGSGAFDSYASAMSLIALVADAALEKSGLIGKRNVVRIATAHDFLNELDGEDLGYRRSVTKSHKPKQRGELTSAEASVEPGSPTRSVWR